MLITLLDLSLQLQVRHKLGFPSAPPSTALTQPEDASPDLALLPREISISSSSADLVITNYHAELSALKTRHERLTADAAGLSAELQQAREEAALHQAELEQGMSRAQQPRGEFVKQMVRRVEEDGSAAASPVAPRRSASYDTSPRIKSIHSPLSDKSTIQPTPMAGSPDVQVTPAMKRSSTVRNLTHSVPVSPLNAFSPVLKAPAPTPSQTPFADTSSLKEEITRLQDALKQKETELDLLDAARAADALAAAEAAGRWVAREGELQKLAGKATQDLEQAQAQLWDAKNALNDVAMEHAEAARASHSRIIELEHAVEELTAELQQAETAFNQADATYQRAQDDAQAKIIELTMNLQEADDACRQLQHSLALVRDENAVLKAALQGKSIHPDPKLSLDAASAEIAGKTATEANSGNASPRNSVVPPLEAAPVHVDEVDSPAVEEALDADTITKGKVWVVHPGRKGVRSTGGMDTFENGATKRQRLVAKVSSHAGSETRKGAMAWAKFVGIAAAVGLAVLSGRQGMRRKAGPASERAPSK